MARFVPNFAHLLVKDPVRQMGEKINFIFFLFNLYEGAGVYCKVIRLSDEWKPLIVNEH